MVKDTWKLSVIVDENKDLDTDFQKKYGSTSEFFSLKFMRLKRTHVNNSSLNFG